ncbi:hypothetical protein R1flu_019737 [Riccia fluitans]|uniref:Transposase n=1 Tax=Riccia fluitans TaxID=41844 RepID=A0ABD1ZN02_9MARC
METWGLGGLFGVDWNGTYEKLLEELADRKVAVPKWEYRGKPKEWTSDIWREVYNLPKASLGGYTMKGKVQFTELQLLRVVKGDRRPKHFQHFLLAFYHHAWVAISNLAAPTPDWGDAIEKTVTRQIKALGVRNEATCIGPYLMHLYNHFHEMDVEEEDSKKRKALIQTVSNSDTKTETKDEKETAEEVPRTCCDGKASGSKPLDQKIDYNEWGIRLESLGH